MRSVGTLNSILMIVIVMLFSACSEVAPQIFSVSEETQDVVVAYDPSEGTNPYLTDALVTHQLGSLLYSSLFILDESLSITPLLASGITAADENTVFSISLNNGFTFEDSSPITAQDVAASLIAAKESSYYSQRLQNIDTVSVIDNIITIQLFTPDAYFPKLLTMPILKGSEVNLKTPSSSGDYRLLSNSLVARGESDNIVLDEINLIHLSQPRALSDGLNMGMISVLDTTFLSDFVPNSDLSKSLYPTTSMLFIGFAADVFTASERVFISSIIDRKAIVDNVFAGDGFESIGIINPAYSFCEQEILQLSEDLDSDEYTLLYNGKVANRDAVVSQLETAFATSGVKLKTIRASSDEHFNELMLLSEYDIYLAEILLPENLDFSFFINNESLGNTEYFSPLLIDTYHVMKRTGVTDDFCNLFAEQQPIAPIMFKAGTVYYSRELTNLTPQNSSPYYRFNEVVYD